MKMEKKKLWILLGLALVLILGLEVFFLYDQQTVFNGSRIKNPDEYILDIERMNGTDLHTLELKEDDILEIRFETVKGSLYMEIKAPDGTTVYSGNGKEATDFSVNIGESGVYTIVIEARQAKGNIHIRLKESIYERD